MIKISSTKSFKDIYIRLKPYQFFFQILISLLLLINILRTLDIGLILNLRQEVNPHWIFLSIFVINCSFILSGLRWGLLMKNAGFSKTLFQYVGIYFSGSLINQGLPSTLGGDAYRALVIAKENEAGLRLELVALSFKVVFFDRIIGLIGNVGIGSIGLMFGGEVIAPIWNSIGILIVSFIAIIYFFLGIITTHKYRNLTKRFFKSIKLEDIFSTFEYVFSFPNYILQFSVSLLIHLLNLIALGCCIKAFGESVPIEALMIGVPAVSLLTVLPLSISGWGLRETTLTAILVNWKINSSITILGSVCYGGLVVFCLTPGIYYLIYNKANLVQKK